jgi:AP2-associated kinase
MEQLAGCPYIVRLHDAAVAGPPTAPTAAFVLMDFCPDTLVAFLQQRAYQVEDATLLRIAMPICRAVEAMHGLQQPLAHRCVPLDPKP